MHDEFVHGGYMEVCMHDELVHGGYMEGTWRVGPSMYEHGGCVFFCI